MEEAKITYGEELEVEEEKEELYTATQWQLMVEVPEA